jgi:DNA-binding winged helix-turn-helix (wHTH) protein
VSVAEAFTTIMRQSSKDFYEFGDFKIDSVERVLLREGELVPLTPKVFDLLLIENNGHMVEKDRLMKEVWPDAFVEEGNLTQNISVLRKVLSNGEEGHQYIQTIPRRGYRFVGRIRTMPDVSEELIIEEHSRSTIVVEQRERADADIIPAIDSNG